MFPGKRHQALPINGLRVAAQQMTNHFTNSFTPSIWMLLALLGGCSTPPTQNLESTRSKGLVNSFDGVPIAFETRGSGSTALVFVHGWSCDRSFWSNQLDAFESQYRLVALDLAGHGVSGRSREHWTLDSMAKDVASVITPLKLNRILLIGHSMGGPVCLKAAPLIGGKVVGIIGVDTLQNAEFQYTDSMIDPIAKQFETQFQSTMALAIQNMYLPSAPEALVNWTITKASETDPRAGVELLRDFKNLNLVRLMRETRLPIRCINAQAMEGGSYPTATEINQKYADFQAILMEDVGHFVMMEKPVEFNAHLRSVIETLLK